LATGYDLIYLGLVARLPQCDLEEAAHRLGLEYIDGEVRVRFLKREYRISPDGVEPLDGQPVSANARSVLLHYLLSTGRGGPQGSYVSFQAIPSMVGGLNLQSRLMNAPLERYFAHNYGAFREAAERLEGIEEETQAGKHVWRFSVLPKIPLKLVFYEADDEFPVSTQIMLDTTAPQFLEFECLAFMVGCLVHALIKTAQHGDVVG